MAKWLVTWEWTGEHARVDEKVAAILDSRIGSERVRQTMELLYVNARYALGERLAYAAKRFNPYPAEYGTLNGVGWQGEITCGHNPWLRARMVDNLKVERGADGEELMTWTERPRWEKLMIAVSGMAKSEKSLQERLADAYISSIIRLEAEDLPGELQEDFRALEDAMDRVDPVGDEGSARASARRMPTEEARQWIEKIVFMYDDVTMRRPWQSHQDEGEE